MRAILSLLLLLFSASAHGVQSLTALPNRPSCECKLTLRRIVTLSGARHDFIDSPAAINVTRDERLLFVPQTASHQIYVLSRSGQLLSRLGASGGGPGEFRKVVGIRKDPADSVHVVDSRNARRTVFTPDLRLARSERVPLNVRVDGVVPLGSGGSVLASNTRSRALAGLPLHFVVGGNVVRSFGSATGYRADQFGAGSRVIGSAGEAGVWAAFRSEYRVERWGIDGRLRQVITRKPAWFQPWTKAVSFAEAIQPLVVSVREDRDGLLWLIVLVGAADWRERGEIKNTPDGRGFVPGEAAFESMIEVVDPHAGRLLYSGRVRRKLQAILDNGWLVSYREDSGGFPVVEIWEPVLTGREGAQ